MSSYFEAGEFFADEIIRTFSASKTRARSNALDVYDLSEYRLDGYFASTNLIFAGVAEVLVHDSNGARVAFSRTNGYTSELDYDGDSTRIITIEYAPENCRREFLSEVHSWDDPIYCFIFGLTSKVCIYFNERAKEGV